MDARAPSSAARARLHRQGRPLDWIAARPRRDVGRARASTRSCTARRARCSRARRRSPFAFSSSCSARSPRTRSSTSPFHGAKGMFNGLRAEPRLQQHAASCTSTRGCCSRSSRCSQGENALYVRPGSGKIPEVTLVVDAAQGAGGAASSTALVKKLARARRRTKRDASPASPACTIARPRTAWPVLRERRERSSSPTTAGIRAVEALRATSVSPTATTSRGAKDASGMPAKTQELRLRQHQGWARLRRAAGPARTFRRKSRATCSRFAPPSSTPPRSRSEIQVTFFLRIK